VEKGVKMETREKTLEERVKEYLEALKGQELTVRDMARALKVDEKRLRRALRKIRANDENLVWARVKGRLVYIYHPTEEQREKLLKVRAKANNKPVVKVEEIAEEMGEESAGEGTEEIPEDIGEVTLTEAK
jgi:predicted ArsR family transcriptional regulator